eukprot:1161923-Pelagomonas_calceolata.AAC.1
MTRTARQEAWQQCAHSAVTLTSTSHLFRTQPPKPPTWSMIPQQDTSGVEAPMGQEVEGDLVAPALAWSP